MTNDHWTSISGRERFAPAFFMNYGKLRISVKQISICRRIRNSDNITDQFAAETALLEEENVR